MGGIILLSVLGAATLTSGVFNYRKVLLPLTLFGLAVTFLLVVGEWNGATTFFETGLAKYNHGMLNFRNDHNFAFAFTTLLLLASLLVLTLSQFHVQEDLGHAGEYY